MSAGTPVGWTSGPYARARVFIPPPSPERDAADPRAMAIWQRTVTRYKMARARAHGADRERYEMAFARVRCLKADTPASVVARAMRGVAREADKLVALERLHDLEEDLVAMGQAEWLPEAWSPFDPSSQGRSS